MLQPNQNINFEIGSSFTNYYKNLGDKPCTLIRIFNRGEYYTVHDDDAIYAAKNIFNTTGVVKYYIKDHQKLPYLILSQQNFESFVRKLLLIKNYCVEIHKSVVGKNDWKLELKASPGNLWQLEDILYSGNFVAATSSLLSLKIKSDGNQNVFGASYYEDTGSLQFKILEFIDNDQLTNLEALIVHLGPKECLLSGPLTPELTKIKELFERNNVLLSERKKSEFAITDIVQDMNKLLKFGPKQTNNFATFAEYQKFPSAMGALAAIIKYLDLLGEDRQYNMYSLAIIDIENYMKIDASAIKALNLFPEHPDLENFNDGNKRTPHNLYALLNKCRTSQGQRLLQRWIKQPLLDVNKIEERLNIVEIFISNFELRKTFAETHLRRMPDFQKIARKFMRKKASLQDIYRIYKAVTWLPYMLESIRGSIDGPSKNHQTLISLFSTRISEIQSDFHNYCQMCELMIDIERVETAQEYFIKPEFDEDLKTLKDSLDAVEYKIASHFKGVARDLGLEQGKTIKLDYGSPLGYYYRITKKEEKNLRGNKRYTTIDTNKNGVRFKDAKLEEFNLSYNDTKSSYEEHQKIVVTEILNIASGYVDPLIRLSDVTAELDVLISFAEVSIDCSAEPYVRPRLLSKEERIIEIKQARNPCIELQDGMSFIPNDVHFKKDDTTFYIITGPNMGGKSTYIRTAGMVVLMAQIGCYVPCSASTGPPTISIIDGIFCRIGSADSQCRGVSTFMAEMIETTAILKQATEYSLIIIDELGRGTSTYDGFGLAWAISEHIVLNIGCFTFFATHFHELTQLAHEITFTNKSTFDQMDSDNTICNTNNNKSNGPIKNIHVSALITDSTEHKYDNANDINTDEKNEASKVKNQRLEDKKLVLLYKIKPGVCDRSFGIHIAKMAKFPESVIEMAKLKAEELGDISYDDYYADVSNADMDYYKDKKEGMNFIKEYLTRLKDDLKPIEFAKFDADYESLRAKIKIDLKNEFKEKSKNNQFLQKLLKKYDI